MSIFNFIVSCCVLLATRCGSSFSLYINDTSSSTSAESVASGVHVVGKYYYTNETSESGFDLSNHRVGDVVQDNSEYEIRLLQSAEELEDPLSVRYPLWMKLAKSSPPWKLMKDFWFLNHLSDRDIAPQPIVLLNDDWELGIVMKSYSDEGFLNCDSPMSMKRSVEYGIRMIKILNELYEAGVVHGNVRVDNFILTEEDGLRIANFEHARFVGEEEERNWPATPWNFEPISSSRKETTFRDDLFGAVMSIAALMNGPRYTEIMQGRMYDGTWQEMIESPPTSGESLFWALELPHPLDSPAIGEFTKVDIQRALISIQSCVLHITPDDDMSSVYEAIMGKLQYISILLE